MKHQFHFFDLHVHTPFSDAQFPLDIIVEGLINNGIEIVGFADHVFPLAMYHNPKRFGAQRRFNNGYSVDLLKYRKEFFQIYNRKFPRIRFLHSAEVDINPRGQLTLPPAIKPDFFDYLLVVKHHTMPTFPREIHENMWEAGIYKAFAEYKPDILAHPHEGMPKHLPSWKLKRLVLYAKKFDVALELNKNKFNEERLKPMLEYGHEHGVKFSLCSDFHGFKKDIIDELNYSQHMFAIAEKYDLELVDPRKFLPENRKEKNR